MKKKFINGFLMVAMVFATTSSFVSCKDNIDDDLSDVYAQLSTTRSLRLSMPTLRLFRMITTRSSRL